MLKKVLPIAIYFIVITIVGFWSKNIYIGTLPLAETTDVIGSNMLMDSFSAEDSIHAVLSHAIRQDNNGYYILQINKEQTSLGERIYAKRVNIFIGETVGDYTEILQGIVFLYPVILNAAIREGAEIRIY